MKRTILVIALFAFGAVDGGVAQCSTGSPSSAREIVQQLWSMATWGDLSSDSGWDKASQSFFTKPNPVPRDKSVAIISNEWGPPSERMLDSDSAEVEVGFRDLVTFPL